MVRQFAAATYTDPDALDVGESTLPRTSAEGSYPVVSGQMRFTYFIARKTETVNQIRLATGSTAAAATPTVCRVGLYSVAADGALTLVASTANDTTLFAAVNTAYTRSVTTPYQKVAGQRYALGIIVVTAATAPSFAGTGFTSGAELAVSPRKAAALSGQNDLPASVAAASLALSGSMHYVVVAP